jgi:hypothetical protein
MTRCFSAFIGFSAFSHLIVVVGNTIAASVLNRPYSPVDAIISRVEFNPLLVSVGFVNYLSVISGLGATWIAGFNRDATDGWVHAYIFFFVIALIYTFISGYSRGSMYQDCRAFRFYVKYCDYDGQLKDEYIEKIKASRNDEKA